MLSLRDKVWSPYAAGVIIGLLQIPAFLLVDTALGASSSFVTAAGYLALRRRGEFWTRRRVARSQCR